MEHLRRALTNRKYPKWALGKAEKRLTRSTHEVNDGATSQGTAGTRPTTNEVKTKGHIVIPYTQGFCKSIKRSVGGMVYKHTSKVVAPSKTYWSPPRTKTPWSTKSGAIYWFQCGDLTFDDECVGETSRTFEERFKEHLKDPSPIHHHSSNTGHPTTQQNFQIIGRDGMVYLEILKNLYLLG